MEIGKTALSRTLFLSDCHCKGKMYGHGSNHFSTLFFVRFLTIGLEYAERTLAYLERLWGHETVLETAINGANMILSYNDKGFTTRLR